MKWFDRLKPVVRVLIAISAWLPLIAFAALNPDSENLSDGQYAIAFAFLALAVVFTVFAIRAAMNESRAKKKAQVEQATADKIKADEENNRLNNEFWEKRFAERSIEQESRVRVSVSVGDIKLPLYTKLAGVTFDNRQDLLAQSSAGDTITIEHKPSTEFPEKTEVLSDSLNEMLGHVKKELAYKLVDAFGEGFVLTGEIAEITGDEVFGCNIVINNVN